eukprot:TRINITY_DN10333_c0_g1_i1.p1 TRINITY_DN10333_c0_g1~~TRINITY_DN10333_c0_g1_i1.p1  ORF type:complete len:120 (+),score=14.36 TRINITY_DN10333_c0_g1_i1:57-362(+)
MLRSLVGSEMCIRDRSLDPCIPLRETMGMMWFESRRCRWFLGYFSSISGGVGRRGSRRDICGARGGSGHFDFMLGHGVLAPRRAGIESGLTSGWTDVRLGL